jgi:hypothetical protein
MNALRALVWPFVIVVISAALYVGRVEREMVDFGVYRTAAGRALLGEPLYRADDGHYQFKYLPAFAVALVPLALVDGEGAKVIWFALSMGCLAALMRWSIGGLPERRRSERLLLWATLVVMAKFYGHELLLGQSNLLLAALLVGALLAIQVDAGVAAGALVGLAVFVKPYAMVLLPWLPIVAGLQAVGAAALVVATGLTAPAVVYGWSGNIELLQAWYRTVYATTAPNLLGADNVSFMALWAKWIGPGAAATRLATLSSLGALAASVWVVASRRRVAEPAYLEFSLLLLVVPLLSPQGWDYVLLLATPAVVLVVDRLSELSRGWRITATAGLAVMGLTIFDLVGRTVYAQLMAWSVITVAALVVGAVLLHFRARALA